MSMQTCTTCTWIEEDGKNNHQVWQRWARRRVQRNSIIVATSRQGSVLRGGRMNLDEEPQANVNDRPSEAIIDEPVASPRALT
jgi:hypothetical protein